MNVRTLTEVEQQILLGAVADLEYFRELTIQPWHHSHPDRLAVNLAYDGVVKCNARRWAPNASGAAVSRAYASLEAAGLVDRQRWEQRTSRLKITPRGIKLADDIARKQVATRKAARRAAERDIKIPRVRKASK